jgi:ubiquinone/menaquinone biosynthesis C-methylase UbiE
MLKKRFFFEFLINILGHWNFRRTAECSTLIRWLDIKPGERVLDVGCGDGYYDMIIAKSGAKVTGIDIHEKRLSKAQRLYRNERSEFLYMNAEEMSFGDASFDRVVSFCVVEHFHHDERVMQNISRVLKPGGCFVFSVDSLSNPEITAEERARHKQRYGVYAFYTIENVREKLSRTGFDIEKVQYLMTKAYELALIRLSWKLDNHLHGALAFIRVPAYLVLGVVYKVVSLFPGWLAYPSKNGITLLIHAKKRGAEGACQEASENRE